MKTPVDTDSRIRQAVELQNGGDTKAAASIYDAVLIEYPNHPDVLHFRGIIHRQNAENERARDLIARAIAIQPSRGRAHYDLGVTLAALGRGAEAVASLETAIRHEPNLADAHYMLGLVTREAGDAPRAAICARAAVRLAPTFHAAQWLLCACLQETGDMDGLLEAADAALKFHPESGELHIYRSEALFAKGELIAAWEEYVWRFRTTKAAIPDRRFTTPRWRGENLSGRSIAVWSEQGIGDVVMYAGMINDLVNLGGHCTFQVPARLKSLMARSLPRIDVVGQDGDGFPGQADFESPLAGLGRWLRPTFESFGHGGSYLKADPALVQRFREKYRGREQVVLVGIAWRSSSVPNDKEKSIELRQWGAVLSVPGARFISLQYGNCSKEIEAAGKGFGVAIIQDHEVDPLGDLDTYAAQISAMDLVISSGNTAAHLAGALGVPTICMLPDTVGHGRRWYWFADREPCPWYRSVRCVSRPSGRTWSWPLTIAALALVQVAAAKGAMTAPTKYLSALAASYRRAGLTDELSETLAAQMAHNPGDSAAPIELARLRKAAGDASGALSAIDRAIAINPINAESWNDRGMILAAAGRRDDALQAYSQGLAYQPNSVTLRNNAGLLLRQSGAVREAIDHYRAAYTIAPSNTSILLGLAGSLAEIGALDEALERFRELLALSPGHVEGRCQYAYALLKHGRLLDGWAELRWRWRQPTVHIRPDAFPVKLWGGEAIEGRRILVYTEQGIGDEILAATMIPDALEVAESVGVMCSDRIAPLLARSFPKAVVAPRAAPLPPSLSGHRFDVLMSMSELGLRFRRQMADFKPTRPILRADQALTARLRQRYLAKHPGHLLVGLSWRSIHPDVGALKSGRLGDWTNLLEIPGVTFVNLQYGDTESERMQLPDALRQNLMHDAEIDPLVDLDAAAAQTAAVDLVITVSNTTAHMAGALGVETLAILSLSRGRIWYWFNGRDDAPWYRAVRLYSTEASAGALPVPSQIIARVRALAQVRKP